MKQSENLLDKQQTLFEEKIEFIAVESVIGSGYENDVAKLAIEDKVAYRAARKNMQIHSAIILKINDEFAGFFTFQINHDAKEFCLLQSAMDLSRKDKKIYSRMVMEIVKQNTYGYPMVMTVSQVHDLENPKVFAAIGFKEYLNLSGYSYMVYGTLEQVRMKMLAHATIDTLRSRKDKTWSITIGTQELTPDQAAEIMKLNGQLCAVGFKFKDFAPDEKELLESINPDLESKSFSKRLRNALYVWFTQEPQGFKDFASFYEHFMNKYIENVKSKLEP